MSATADEPPIETVTGPDEVGVESTNANVRDNGSGISRDDLFDVLSNHRRRYALHSLKQRDGPVDIGNLAEEIAAWENDVSMAELTAADRKRVYTALQQFHVPKMDAAGIVAFDSARSVVTLTEGAETLDVYLDIVPKNDIPWSRYYLGLSMVSLAVVAGVWLSPFALVPGMAWAVFVAVAFAVSSFVHSYSNRRMHLGSDGEPPELREH